LLEIIACGATVPVRPGSNRHPAGNVAGRRAGIAGAAADADDAADVATDGAAVGAGAEFTVERGAE
jgi:hypothetical protein